LKKKIILKEQFIASHCKRHSQSGYLKKPFHLHLGRYVKGTCHVSPVNRDTHKPRSASEIAVKDGIDVH